MTEIKKYNNILAMDNRLLIVLLFLQLFFLFASCNPSQKKNGNDQSVQTDILSESLEKTADRSIDIEIRKEILQNVYQENRNQGNDSIKKEGLLKIAFIAYKLNDSIFFKKTNQEALEYCIKLKDTFGIADAHWNYGNFYGDIESMYSAYFHYQQAYENFEAIGHKLFAAKMLYNMAVIQKDIKDYTGSEVLTFQAMSKFKELDKSLNIYLCYNLLGAIYNEIKEYKRALYYHRNALEYLKKVKNKRVFKESSINNLGLVYQKQGKYHKSINQFKIALASDSLKYKNIILYSKLLDNLAYSKFLSGDTIDLPLLFLEALHIRDSAKNISGICISKMHLAEFFAERKDTVNALLNLKEALRLSKEVNNNRVVLKTLMLLSEFDKNKAGKYLKDYVQLSDSLQGQERKQRNKFTRIRFETDEYIAQTKILYAQRKMILIVAIIIILLVSLLFIIRMLRSKNRELLFEQKQQKANKEIYGLMLKQQQKLEEGKLKERNRIACDLHDGTLSKLFGIRMGLGFLKLKGNEETLSKYKSLLEELHHVEKEIKDISHELQNDILSPELNFEMLIEDLTRKQSETGGFEYKLFNDDLIIWSDIDDAIKINCYRIIQEATQNIIKHANARLVIIEFSLISKKIKLTISDDGCGFKKGNKTDGIGLKNIKFRVQNINAKFRLNSTLNKGTLLTILIPIKT